MEKKISFSVDDKNVTTYMDRLKKSAEELGRGMIKDARAYTTSGTEVVRVIEEQIRAMDKRNKADVQVRRVELDQRLQAGTVSKEGYNKGITDIRRGSEEDKVQISLLRELIDTTKYQAKEELRSDRKNVEEQIKNSRTVEQLNPKGDEVKLLEESIQKAELARIKKTEAEEKFWSKTNQKTASGINTLTGMATSGNTYGAVVAGGVGMGQLITSNIVAQAGLGLVSAVVSQALNAAAGYEKGLTGLSQISGESYHWYGDLSKSSRFIKNRDLPVDTETKVFGNESGSVAPADVTKRTGTYVTLEGQKQLENKRLLAAEYQSRQDSVDNFYDSAKSMGYSRQEILQISAQNARATGTGVDLESSLKDAKVSRALGIDMGQISGMNKLARTDKKYSGDSEAMTQDLIQRIRGGGMVMQGSDTALLPEYLNTLTQISQQQLQVLGRVDVGINNKTIAAFASLDENLAKQPELIGQVVAQFRTGLGESGNENLKALQYTAISRVMPGRTQAEMQRVMEAAAAGGEAEGFKGMGLEDKYRDEYLRLVKSTGGSSKNMQGKALRQAELAGSYNLGYQLTDIDKAFKGGKLGDRQDLVKQASEDYGVGKIQASSAAWSQFFEKNGEKAVSVIDGFVSGMTSILGMEDKVEKMPIDVNNAAKSLDNFAKSLKDAKETTAKTTAGGKILILKNTP